MSRRTSLPSPDHPFFLGARNHNRKWFLVSTDEAWKIYENWLYFISFAFKVKIHSFVLMNNHFHMLGTFPLNNMSEAMGYFMRETSRNLNDVSGKINQSYGSRYYRCRISTHHQFMNVYKYIYRNPVEAGIVQHAEDYKYSTLHTLVGRTRHVIPIEDEFLYKNYYESLRWINQEPLKVHKKQIENALKRADFKLSHYRSSKNLSALETDLY